MILPIFRRTLLSGACVLLLAGCGGGDENTDIPSDRTAVPADTPAFSTPPTPQVTQPAPAAPAPGATAPNNAGREPLTTKEILDAPVTGPVNVQTLEDYQLSMEVLRKLVRGGQNLAELQERRPELRDSMRLEGFDPNAIYEKLNGIPEAREAVTRAGMSPREYATAMAALMQAVIVYTAQQRGMQTPIPVQVNEANVEFVGEHLQEIQQLMQSAAQQARPRS